MAVAIKRGRVLIKFVNTKRAKGRQQSQQKGRWLCLTLNLTEKLVFHCKTMLAFAMLVQSLY